MKNLKHKKVGGSKRKIDIRKKDEAETAKTAFQNLKGRGKLYQHREGKRMLLKKKKTLPNVLKTGVTGEGKVAVGKWRTLIPQGEEKLRSERGKN